MKKYFTSCLAAACLLAGAGGLSANTVMSGGAYSVPTLAALSGGVPALGGTLSLVAFNIGGPAASDTRLSGGSFTADTGEAPAVIVYESAMADLSGAHCYPVPFKPSAGHARITFTGLTRSARVRVFTLGGELVRTLDKSDSGDTLDWDVKNSRGEDVVSGVYFFTIKSASQTVNGKLMIIR